MFKTFWPVFLSQIHAGQHPRDISPIWVTAQTFLWALTFKTLCWFVNFTFLGPHWELFSPYLLVKSTSNNTRGTSALAESRHKPFWGSYFQDFMLIRKFHISRSSSPFQESLQKFSEKGKFRARLVLLLQQSNWIDRIAGIALKSIEKILREKGKLLSKKSFNYSVSGFFK